MKANIYGRNLEILKERFPDLAALLPAFRDCCTVLKTETAKDGNITASLNGVYLHSGYKPALEASRYAELYKGEKNICFVIEGCGLGYLAQTLCIQHPKAPVIIAEADLELMADQLACRDFSEILKQPYLYFIAAAPASSVNSILSRFRDFRFVPVRNKTLFDRYNDFYTELEDHIRKFTARRDVNNLTLRKFGRLWVKNLFANFSGGKINCSIDIFRDKFADCPALVLAAGPSLDDNRELIRSMAEKCLVIAVDSSVNFCSSNSIHPDFIITVDPQYYNSRHLDRLPDRKTVLIAESSTCSRSIRRHNGPVVVGASFFPLGEYFDKIFRFHEKLGAGGSVATAAWDFARLCGCSEIYIAGLDLGYLDGKTHYTGSHYETAFSAETSRLTTADTYAMKLSCSTGTVFINDFSGNRMKSDQRLNVYRWWFEQQNKKYPAIRTWTIDKRSSFIEGFGIPENLLPAGMTPRPADIESRISREITNGGNIKISEKVEQLKNDLERINSLVKSAGRLILRFAHASNSEYREILAELDNIDSRIMEGNCNVILSFLLQDEISEVRAGSGGDNPIEKSQKLYQSIRRTAEIYIYYIKKYFY